MSEINNKITLPFMTETELAALSVSALSDRPNENSGQYGRKGLTPAELKAAFSALPVKIADRLNALIPKIAARLEAAESAAFVEADHDGCKLLFKSVVGDTVAELDLEEMLSEYWSTDVGKDGVAPPTAKAVKEYTNMVYGWANSYTDAKTNFCIDALNARETYIKAYSDEKIAGAETEIKEYVDSKFANAIKGTLSGGAVYLEDIDPLYTNLNLKSSTVPYQLFVSGRNILNTKADGVSSQNGASYVDTSDLGTIVWKTGGAYYVKIPVYIPKGCTVSYSLKWNTESTDQLNNFSRVCFTGVDPGNRIYAPEGSPFTDTFIASDNIYNMLIYKYAPSDNRGAPLTADVTISEICVNLTDEAIYTPFLGYVANTIDKTMYPAYILADSVNEGVTLIPGRDYKVDMTVEYLRDSTKVIDKLTRKIQALQNATVT